MKTATRKEKKIELGRVRRILAAFDGSDDSRRALTYARRLARQRHAKLAVIQVIAPLFSMADFGYGPVQRQTVDGHKLQETKRRLTRLVNGTGTSLVRCGSPWAEILKAALELRTDIIVIGGHRNELPESMGCAGTGEPTTLKAMCPVLIVRRDGVELSPASDVHAALQ